MTAGEGRGDYLHCSPSGAHTQQRTILDGAVPQEVSVVLVLGLLANLVTPGAAEEVAL